MKEAGVHEIFYDRHEGGVDFLLQNLLSGKIVPIEVGAEKGLAQVLDAMSCYKLEYGIIVTDVPETRYEQKQKNVKLAAG